MKRQMSGLMMDEFAMKTGGLEINHKIPLETGYSSVCLWFQCIDFKKEGAIEEFPPSSNFKSQLFYHTERQIIRQFVSKNTEGKGRDLSCPVTFTLASLHAYAYTHTYKHKHTNAKEKYKTTFWFKINLNFSITFIFVFIFEKIKTIISNSLNLRKGYV